jgi:hypothetical protein
VIKPKPVNLLNLKSTVPFAISLKKFLQFAQAEETKNSDFRPVRYGKARRIIDRKVYNHIRHTFKEIYIITRSSGKN